MTEFIMGFVSALFIAIWVSFSMDSNFDYHKNRVNKLTELCSKHNSAPKSFDGSIVICANNVSIRYRNLIG